MFTKGQIIFAVLFVIGFAAFIFRSYAKDKKLHQKNYKGVKWVAIAFFVFIALLFVIKKQLNF